MTDATSLLHGLRILSFCHYLQGPAASQYLADLGADVVKVEPLGGAFERHWAGADAFVDGISAFFLSANGNKRSLALDLKHPEGRAIVERLLPAYDVVLENYRPGVMDRLGLGYDALKAIKPDLIYASATGFGRDGPLSEKPGQDLIMQARTGLIAASSGGDVAVGCAAIDQHGAALLAMGILAAYVRRLKTGVGTRVEGSLFNAGIDLQAESLTLYYSGGHDAASARRDPHLATWFHQAPYGVYHLQDAVVALSLINPKALAKALGDEAVAEAALGNAYEGRDRLAAAVARALAERSFAGLSQALDAEHLWYERVQTYDDLRTDPQALHNGVFCEMPVGNGRATLVAHPLRYDDRAPPPRRFAFAPGDDTDEVLREAGFAPADIDRLADRNIIRMNHRQGRAE